MPVCLSRFTYLLDPKMARNCMLLLSQPGMTAPLQSRSRHDFADLLDMYRTGQVKPSCPHSHREGGLCGRRRCEQMQREV